ncbi:MAG: hypothetical protein LH471_08755, partial [Salinibacterium sp.]|nr:hypothetical protein [Salinibacterium sp.]
SRDLPRARGKRAGMPVEGRGQVVANETVESRGYEGVVVVHGGFRVAAVRRFAGSAAAKT